MADGLGGREVVGLCRFGFVVGLAEIDLHDLLHDGRRERAAGELEAELDVLAVLVLAALDVGEEDRHAERTALAEHALAVLLGEALDLLDGHAACGEHLVLQFAHGPGGGGHLRAPHGARGGDFELREPLGRGRVGEGWLFHVEHRARVVLEGQVALEEPIEGGVDDAAVQDGVEERGLERRDVEAAFAALDGFDGAAETPINNEFWTAEIGGHGWGNNELEYYTDRIENVSLDGQGNLAINAIQENPGDYTCHYGVCEYTSARIVTMDKFQFTYGRVEARLKIPRGQGIWPAFWMLGADFGTVGWPGSGEIDIMENVGKEPRIVYGTVHGPGYSGGNGIGGTGLTREVDYADDFHVYAIDWDVDAIRWYIDGELFQIVSLNDLNGREWVFNHDFFLILNVAVGGNWPGMPDETTVMPQQMLVDYVRVYQLAE